MAGDVREFPLEVFERRPQRFILEDFDVLEPGVALERVKGLWPRSGLCFVGGPSMSGKSFWTLDALARICRGEPVLGRRSVGAGVLYIASEGAAGVRKRIKALRGKIGPLGGAFQFIGQAPNLCDTDDLAELRETIVAAQTAMMADGRELGVVAIDTLSASVPGADENSAADMSPVLHALQEMARELDLLFLVIAHTGKDEGRGLRGWSGLLANADGVVMLESPDGATRMGSVTKVKDGLSGDRFAFELQRVVLGLDEDGDEITSCIIEEADAPEGPRAGRKPAKASGTAALILSAFDRVLAEKPRPIPAKAPGVPRGVSGVNVNDLRAVAYEIGVGGGPADIPSDASPEERKRNEARWHDQRRKDFKRGLDHLLETQTLRLQDEIVWIAAAKAGVGP
ncbi:MAG: AAA family ATPase [Phenylobacterium sp.]|uniref:AAA family ATPase n=1 Tax=Phenylobacterium sp. TaxID=1871053 RepID=UPI0025CE0D50|nr:AAA family ATPase [Phenylobacterium sp.]MCA3732100.1 AAA family ATPase [Phenylobacterium sp.]